MLVHLLIKLKHISISSLDKVEILSMPFHLVRNLRYLVVDNFRDSARSVNCMKRLGVTYVLNAALGKDLYHVNTNHVMYERANIHFLGIEATDFINCDLSKHFFSAADFIHAGVTSGGGR